MPFFQEFECLPDECLQGRGAAVTHGRGRDDGQSTTGQAATDLAVAVDTRTHNPSQPHAGRSSSSSSSRRRAHLAIVVAGRPLPNAVAVDTRTHTPRHNHTQGAAATAEEDVARNNATP